MGDTIKTFPQILLDNAKKYSDDKIAIREKGYGIWQSYTWQDYLEQARDFALGLASLGFNRGDVMAVIGDNRPHLYWGLAAAQCLGGVPVPFLGGHPGTERSRPLFMLNKGGSCDS